MISSRYRRFRIPGRKRVHIGQDEVAGAVFFKLFLVFLLDYGEGAEYVLRVVAGHPVKVEVKGVESSPQVTALLVFPDKRRAVIAQISGEGGQVMGRVSEA